MTSNVGSQYVEDWTDPVRSDKMMEELRDFKPEFLNRIDDIVFHSLGRRDRQHRGPAVRAAAQAARERGLGSSCAGGAHCSRPGLRPGYGARPLKRALMRYVQDPWRNAC